MDRTSSPPFVCCASLEGRAKVAASFTSGLFRLLLRVLRHREVAGHPPAGLVHARRAAVDYRPSGVEVDRQASAIHLVLVAHELNVTDQSDQLTVEVVDAEVAFRGLGRAMDDHAAGGVEAIDLQI